MRNTFLLAGIFLLAGCDHFSEDKATLTNQAADDGDQIADNIEKSGTSVADVALDNAKKTGEEFRSWLITPKAPPKSNHAIAASYCYRTQADILCYRQPMAGWETRLVAYQGTDAPPPFPGQTQPLPKRVDDPSLLPANKVAAAKPVFAQIPLPPKEEEKNSDQAPVFDTSHEQLPNPAFSPQM